MLARLTLVLGLVSGTTRADVIRPEPTQLTCGRAEVIAVGTVDGTTTSGPFTNATPPTLTVTATECPKGCKAGDRLEIAQWVDARPVHSGGKSGDPIIEEAAWQNAPVTPPAKGTSVVLFLWRDGTLLRRVQDSGGYGGYVMVVGGDDKGRQRSVAMCQVAAGFAGERDRTAAAGQPVMVRLELTNLTDAPVVFHAESLALTLRTDTKPGEDFAPAWAAPLEPITLGPKADQVLDWDLARLFPGQLIEPGTYWLTLDAPAQLGLAWLAIAVK